MEVAVSALKPNAAGAPRCGFCRVGRSLLLPLACSGGCDFRTGVSWQMQSWYSAGSIPVAWLKQTWAYRRRDLSHVPLAVLGQVAL